MLFSSGTGNLTLSRFVGVGSVSNLETNVQQIVAVSGTATAMQCYIQTAPSVPIMFTLRRNGGNTTLTCTIQAGQVKGVPAGLPVAFNAGDLFDVATQTAPMGSVPSAPGSFAVTTGP